MVINNFTVTSNFIEMIDETCVHLELDNCIRLVHLSDTDFETVNELQTAVEALNFNQ